MVRSLGVWILLVLPWTGWAGEPLDPADRVAAPAQITCTQDGVSWSAVSGARGYQVRWWCGEEAMDSLICAGLEAQAPEGCQALWQVGVRVTPQCGAGLVQRSQWATCEVGP